MNAVYCFQLQSNVMPVFFLVIVLLIFFQFIVGVQFIFLSGFFNHFFARFYWFFRNFCLFLPFSQFFSEIVACFFSSFLPFLPKFLPVFGILRWFFSRFFTILYYLSHHFFLNFSPFFLIIIFLCFSLFFFFNFSQFFRNFCVFCHFFSSLTFHHFFLHFWTLPCNFCRFSPFF